MTITQYTKTIYPTTPQGIKMANEMAEKLKQQGCFVSCDLGTEAITISARYIFDVKDEDDD